jgi:hypothetical protein
MFSAKPMPTKPDVATVLPLLIRATASRALTTFPCSNVRSAATRSATLVAVIAVPISDPSRQWFSIAAQGTLSVASGDCTMPQRKRRQLSERCGRLDIVSLTRFDELSNAPTRPGHAMSRRKLPTAGTFRCHRRCLIPAAVRLHSRVIFHAWRCREPPSAVTDAGRERYGSVRCPHDARAKQRQVDLASMNALKCVKTSAYHPASPSRIIVAILIAVAL